MARIPDSHILTLVTHSADETYRVGLALGRLLAAGDVVCLQGDLGSGKTCLTQGIGAGLGVHETINSPTFVFINEHPTGDGLPYLYHVDLYRIDDPIEALALGLEDYMYGDGVTVIEWAERALELMPEERLWVRLTYLNDSERDLRFEPRGSRYEALVDALAKDVAPDDHDGERG